MGTESAPFTTMAKSLSNQTKAVLFGAISATCLSFIPLAIRVSDSDVDPFLFNAARMAAIGVTLVAFLYASAKSTLGVRPRLRELCGLVAAPIRAQNREIMERTRSPVRRVTTIIKWSVTLPMFWMVVSLFDYALFAWSTSRVDTAVSSTIFELWPLFMVYILARYEPDTSKRGISRQKVVLTTFAPVGLVFVILGQAGDWRSLTASGWGVGLALLAAVGGGIFPAANILLGEQLDRSYSDAGDSGSGGDGDPAGDAFGVAATSDLAKKRKLWFTILGFAVACLLATPLNLVFGLLTFNGSLIPSLRAVIGGVVVGAGLIGAGAVFLRMANLYAKDLSVNAVFYIAPVLALVWLAIFAGIVVPRMDLFLIGAVLVIAINILLQSSPDQEQEFKARDGWTVRGVRLGFSSLILALWSFGTLVYLRDELFPASWMHAEFPDYWAFLGLSATVFALIFGFRLARLTSRIRNEDDSLLRLFRKCEDLVECGQADEQVLFELQRLDRADASELLASYRAIRSRLLAWKTRFEDDEGSVSARSELRRKFPEIASELDMLAHSKQQGRDFSELMSLVSFAGLTIALGILTRPEHIAQSEFGWHGFLTESFVVLFVATIAFLAFNLFDIRRDRQIPLIRATDDAADRFSLYFRYRRDLTVQRWIAVAICVGTYGIFVFLLFEKWM